MKCIIDGTTDEKYLTLGIWGKPVIFYPIQEALNCKLFEQIIVVTKFPYVKYLVEELLNEDVIVQSVFPEQGIIIDGRAANIKAETIIRIVNYRSDDKLVKILTEIDDMEESVLVSNANNFELSLLFQKKRNKEVWLEKMIKQRIAEKKEIFSSYSKEKEIFLIGHSQFDQWNIEAISKYPVRNGGISGITARQYIDYVLSKQPIGFRNGKIFILIGTNELSFGKSCDEVIHDIHELINKVMSLFNMSVYFISILHVNGRLDRENIKIDKINNLIKNKLPSGVKWISTKSMDDPFGNLKNIYTTDGLHLSELGYSALRKLIEHEVLE